MYAACTWICLFIDLKQQIHNKCTNTYSKKKMYNLITQIFNKNRVGSGTFSFSKLGDLLNQTGCTSNKTGCNWNIIWDKWTWYWTSSANSSHKLHWK